MTPAEHLKDKLVNISINHRNIYVYGEFHQVLALLLFPPNCSCRQPCPCKKNREEVALSLNVDLYNQAHKANLTPENLRTLKFYLSIPEDYFLREHYGEVYPLWLIKEEFKKRQKENQFRCVERLVTTLLRLAKTYQVAWGEPKASLNEALERILGKSPLKTKEPRPEEYLGGEKAYTDHFTTYKAVCHFIAALGLLNEEKKDLEASPLNLKFSEMKRFFELSAWFRNKLLELKTPNIKMNMLFRDETLAEMPSLIEIRATDLPIQPFEDKVEEIKRSIQRIDPQANLNGKLTDT